MATLKDLCAAAFLALTASMLPAGEAAEETPSAPFIPPAPEGEEPVETPESQPMDVDALEAAAAAAVELSRKDAWGTTRFIVEQTEKISLEHAPGLREWLRQFREQTQGIDPALPISEWPAVDIDALVTNNPTFWQAQYEVFPGDPYWCILHSQLLISQGEFHRGRTLLYLTVQHESSEPWRNVLASSLKLCQQAIDSVEGLVQMGVARHDERKFDEAIAIYQRALAVCPNSSLAHYELGFTNWLIALEQNTGEPIANKLEEAEHVFDGQTRLDEVHQRICSQSYSVAWKHNPLLSNAWQGKFPSFERSLLARQLQEVWVETVTELPNRSKPEQIEKLAYLLAETGHRDLALFARQILVGRTKGYQTEDYKFIQRHLPELASGPQTVDVLRRLRQKAFNVVHPTPRQQAQPQPQPEATPESDAPQTNPVEGEQPAAAPARRPAFWMLDIRNASSSPARKGAFPIGDLTGIGNRSTLTSAGGDLPPNAVIHAGARSFTRRLISLNSSAAAVSSHSNRIASLVVTTAPPSRIRCRA